MLPTQRSRFEKSGAIERHIPADAAVMVCPWSRVVSRAGSTPYPAGSLIWPDRYFGRCSARGLRRRRGRAAVAIARGAVGDLAMDDALCMMPGAILVAIAVSVDRRWRDKGDRRGKDWRRGRRQEG